jgi:transposase
VACLLVQRFHQSGEESLRPRSSRPKISPNATHVDVVGKILYLRKDYHFGPAKIAMYLERYHDVEISKSGIWRILKRLDISRLPTSAALQATRQALAALRETTPWSPGPDRREVHRAGQGSSSQEARITRNRCLQHISQSLDFRRTELAAEFWELSRPQGPNGTSLWQTNICSSSL